VRDHLGGAEVAHREQRAAVRHERFGEARHAEERVARDVHRAGEALARAVGDAAVQIGGRREGDRVQDEVEPPPLRANRFEQRFQVAAALDVERHGDRRGELLRQRLDVRTAFSFSHVTASSAPQRRNMRAQP
jgi:hypothetical protein